MSLEIVRQTFRKVHHLKCHPEYFEETWMGRKPFEVRVNDRDFQVGDLLHLREWLPQEQRYTLREVAGPITYLTDFGCQPGYVVLGNPKASQVWWASQLEDGSVSP